MPQLLTRYPLPGTCPTERKFPRFCASLERPTARRTRKSTTAALADLEIVDFSAPQPAKRQDVPDRLLDQKARALKEALDRKWGNVSILGIVACWTSFPVWPLSCARDSSAGDADGTMEGRRSDDFSFRRR